MAKVRGCTISNLNTPWGSETRRLRAYYCTDGTGNGSRVRFYRRPSLRSGALRLGE